MKLKNWNCDDTQKTKIVMKPKTHIVMKLKNSNWAEPQNPNSERKKLYKKLKWWKNQKLKWWQNSKTLIGTKLKHLNWAKSKKNPNGDKTQMEQKEKFTTIWAEDILTWLRDYFLSSNLEWHFHDKKKAPTGQIMVGTSIWTIIVILFTMFKVFKNFQKMYRMFIMFLKVILFIRGCSRITDVHVRIFWHSYSDTS